MSLPLTDSPPRWNTIYRPFFKAGILVTLSLGAVWGAYLLIRIALRGSFTAAGPHEVNAHGHSQTFGWVGLFIMVFAYPAFPRFMQTTLAHPRLKFPITGIGGLLEVLGLALWGGTCGASCPVERIFL